MAVLKLNPTKAPNLTGTSEILERAGLSLGRAFDDASSVLTSYQKGQTERADNEVFSEIAKLKTQEQIDAYFDGDGIAGRPISVAARDRLSKMRSNLANLNQVQQQTASGLSATTRLEAVEKDRAAQERDRLTTQRIAREQGPDAVRAYLEGIAQGESGPGSAPVRPGVAPLTGATATIQNAVTAAGPAPVARERSANQQEIFTGMTDRGIPEHIAEGFMMNFQDESGFQSDIVEKDGGAGKGLYQLTGPRRKAFEKKYGADGYTNANQLDFMIEELGGTESAAWKKIQGAKTSEEAAALIVTEFLRPAAEHQKSRSAAYLSSAATEANANVAPQVDPATGQPVDPLSALRAVGGSIGDTIGRGEPGINLISGTGPAGATGEVIPTGPGQQGLSSTQIQPTAIPRGPGTAAAEVLGVGEGGPIVPTSPLVENTPATAAIAASVAPPEVAELMTNPRAARDARIAQIMARPDLTGDQMIAKIDRLKEATNQGEAENLRVETIARQENLTQIATDWANDPKSDMKLETLQKLLAAEPGTAVEKLNAGLYALEIGNGALSSLIKPSYVKDDAVDRGIADELERNRRSLTIQDKHRVMNNAKLFGDDDPVKGLQSLVKSAGVDSKAQTPFIWGFFGADATNEDGLRKLIIHIGNAAGVSPAIAAAAMADRFTPDPAGFNTNEHRFDKKGTIAWLKANLNEDALRVYEGDVERVARREDELNAGRLTLSIMRYQREKMNDSNTTPQQRKDADQAIASIQTTLKSGRTPIEGAEALSDYVGIDGMGISVYLETLEPGSKLYNDTVGFIKLTVEGDPEISSAHKRLLLAAINS